MKLIRNEALWGADAYAAHETESSEQLLHRATDFQRQFLNRLIEEIPELAGQLVFLRVRRRFHPDVELYSELDEGVFAVLDRETGGFGIHVDRDDVITIWNESRQREYADWGAKGKDSQSDAIEHVRECMRKSP